MRCNIDTLTSVAAIEIVPRLAVEQFKDVANRDVEAFGRAGLLNTIDPKAYIERLRRDPNNPDYIEQLHQNLYSLTFFFADRLNVQQKEAGVRHDLIDAVFALGGEDDLVRLLARVHALQSFVATDDGANLLAGYKRAANILKKEAPTQPTTVIPAKAGTHLPTEQSDTAAAMDSRLRGNDGPLSYTPDATA